MYALRANAPNLTFEKKGKKMCQQVTIWSWMSGNGILLGPHLFDGNVKNNTYLDTSHNFVLLQFQDFYDTQFENGSF